MTAPLRHSRATGWFLAGTAAVALMSGVGALALAADGPPPFVTLDLGQMPPTAAAVSAMAAPAPQVADTAPQMPESADPSEAAPEAPATVTAPEAAVVAAMDLPHPEQPVMAEMKVPEKTVRPKPRTMRADDRKAKAQETQEKAKPKRVAEVLGETAAAAPSVDSKPGKSGGMSPAASARAVMKKVRSTRKASGGGKGTAVVGFSIGADGGLERVRLLQSSGSAALDRVALDHIRRAAPFSAPPTDAGRSYSFEFVVK